MLRQETWLRLFCCLLTVGSSKSPRNAFGLAQSWPRFGPKLASSQPIVGPMSPRVGPKSAQSRPKVGPKSAQSRPKVGPESAQVGPESAQSRPKIKAKRVAFGHPAQRQKLRMARMAPPRKVSIVEIHAALHWSRQRPEMTEKVRKPWFFGQISPPENRSVDSGPVLTAFEDTK